MKARIYFIFIVLGLISCMSPAQTINETKTPTQIPSAIPTLTQTPEYVDDIEFSMLSPDGTKIIQTTDWLTFDILDLNNNKFLWSFTYDRAKFGDGYKYIWEGGYTPFFWSQDERYIYISASQGADVGDAFGSVEGVARFDLETGTMTEILPEILHIGGYTFTLTPDGDNIIFINKRDTPLVLRLRNLYSNEEQDLITFNENLLGVKDYAWSPDGDKFVFQTISPDGIDFILFDYKNQKFELIVTGFMEAVNFEFWGKENQLYYADWKKTMWQLDLNTKTVILVDILTLTPNP